jgi:hypothetical protein
MSDWDHPTLTEEEFAKRRLKLLADESAAPAAWWYFSFCDPGRPRGKQFVGALVVKASGYISAIEGTHLLGLNPGGEVSGLEIPYEDDEAEPWAYRLLTREEVKQMPRPRSQPIG